jgi:hypothetical protein
MELHDKTAKVPNENDRRHMELARLGYQAYFDHSNGKSINNEQLPGFEHLPHTILSHWIAAAARIEEEVLSKAPASQDEADAITNGRSQNSNVSELSASARHTAAVEAITTAAIEGDVELEEGEADMIVEEYGDDEVLGNPAKALTKWEDTPDDKRKGKSKGRAARR